MKRSRVRQGGGMCSLAAAVLLIGTAAAQEASRLSLGLAEADAIATAIDQPRPATIVAAASQPRATELSVDAIHQQIRGVMREYVNQRIDYRLDGFYPKPVLFMYGPPEKRKVAELAVGLSVPSGEGFREVGTLSRVDFSPERVVRHVHIGPHEELGEVYERIAARLREQGVEPGWPVALQILNNPLEVEPSQLKTVLNIPLE